MTPQFANLFFGLVVMAVAYYFLVYRPKLAAKKRIEVALETMDAGDIVLTKGGIVGSVVDLDADAVHLKVSEGTTVKVLREFVARIIEKASSVAEA